MKHITKHLLCAALVALYPLALTSCGSPDQTAALVAFASQTTNDLAATAAIEPERANKIQSALDLAGALDLANLDTAKIMSEARLALSGAEKIGAVPSDKALTIRTGLNAVELLIKLAKAKQASQPHASEIPKLATVAESRERSAAPSPRVTTILTRREASQLRRSADTPVRFLAA